MQIRRWLIVAVLCLLASQPASGHAVLERSDPPANAVLAEAPAEIRLWFTEPVEPRFSGFELRDAAGAVVVTDARQTDPADPYGLVMQPGELPDGLYTVVWWNTSAADGHHSEGSFPFTVGAPGAGQPAVSVAAESIPRDATLVRWLNLIGLALAAGALGFVCFVWRPAVSERLPGAEQQMQGVVWTGWVLVGISSLLILLAQTMAMANVALQDALTEGVWRDVVTGTRFGTLWLARLSIWGVMGGLLLLAKRRPVLRWPALGCGILLLLLTSLYGHAAAVQDALPSILADWLHLSMMALWLGGLVALLVVIDPLRRAVNPAAPLLGRLVGHFSNYARVAVVGLVLTGVYAAWLHVGTLEGLVTTLYGRVLLIKLMLFLPLLAVAGVNLVWTHRRLLAGQEIWTGRLRHLVITELVLAITLLAAAGAMTAISPARTRLALQTAAAATVSPAPEPQPIAEMQMVDDLHAYLTISPGWVGDNAFQVALSTLSGEPVADASLIRLRFDHQTENLGSSELRISEGTEGVYSVRGANLSTPGDWRIRMTVQRPDQYDSIIDFAPHVELPPPPPPAPVVEVETTLPYRSEVLAVTGLLMLASGGYFLSKQHFRFWQGAGALASALVGLGCVLLVSAIS